MSSASASLLAGLQKQFASLTLADLPKLLTQSSDANKVTGVIETTTDARLRDVVSLLLKNNISSCPVRKAEYKDSAESDFEKIYFGVIDLLDIVAFVLSILKTTASWGKGFEAVLEAVVQFAEHTVQDVLDASPAIQFQPIPSTATLGAALTLLGKDRFHRVVVIDPATGKLESIVTQSSMAAYLYSKVKSDPIFGAFATQPLSAFGLTSEQKIVSVPLTHKAVDAFHLIQKHRVTGVPVVDNHGSLVGNVSARDIRSMVGSPDKFDRLFDSLGEFLSDIQADKTSGAVPVASRLSHASSPASTGAAAASVQSPVKSLASPFAPQSGKPSSSPSRSPAIAAPAAGAGKWALPEAISVAPSATLSETLETLVDRGIHRVYITRPAPSAVDASVEIRQPVGVVTLTDVMRAFAEGVVLAARRGSLISADAQETLIRLAEAAQKAQEKEKARGEQHE
jgi:CBS domain-containing protein